MPAPSTPQPCPLSPGASSRCTLTPGAPGEEATDLRTGSPERGTTAVTSPLRHSRLLDTRSSRGDAESPNLVLVINDTKLLMPCVKCFELGISNTCDEGVCGKECWPQDHKEMVHGHEMMIMVEMHIK
jgi:hypothetical protein